MRLKTLSLLALLLPPLSGQAVAAQHSCTNPPQVTIVSQNQEPFAEICRAAERAALFLGQFGLELDREITIEIVEKPIDEDVYVAYGKYDSATDRIRLMSYASIFLTAEKPMMYGEPFDRVHYYGVIAHEMAHAVIRDYIKNEKYSMAPQEYLAHVTQLATMPEERRKKILTAMDVEAWEGGDSISHIYMALNPGKFAVKSYLHLMSLADPAGFVQILLNNNWFYVYVPKEAKNPVAR